MRERNKRITIFDKDQLPVHAVSWGLGVQSTAMVAMVLREELPRPDCIIFADPAWEVTGSYECMDHMRPLIEKAGIPFHMVSGGDLREENVTSGRTELPYYVNASRYETIEGKMQLLISDTKRAWYKAKKRSEMSGNLFPESELSLEETVHRACTDFGKKVASGHITSGWIESKTSQIVRGCTAKYKIQPVLTFLRDNYGVSLKHKVGQWLGITVDEWSRMTTSKVRASVLMYPLIDLGLSRDDCELYLHEQGIPVPPKSACIGCPYHSDAMWQLLTDEQVEDAANFEEGVNQMIAQDEMLRNLPYFANGARLHPSMVPIDERPFDDGEEGEDGTPCSGQAGCFL